MSSKLASHSSSGGDEIIHRDDHLQVFRRTLPDGGKIVVKQALDMQAMQRLAHEGEILRRLTDVPGVVKLAAAEPEPNTLVLQDDGGVALSKFLRVAAFDALQWVELASSLARALAGVHKAGVIHKDISPDNILINVATRRPTLIDFNIAAVQSEQNVAAAKHELAGTLPYMSPEQTGRTGRRPDQRSDLYSLGVVLYEVATRRRPFGREDMLELIHDHLVRVPTAPSVVNTAFPQVLSDVTMRLLEKDPDKRYQSADGLLHDLSAIRVALQSGESPTFVLGQFDFGARLSAPAQLIGREAELAALRAAFERARAGRHPCLLISGAAGVGKSALLGELKTLTSGKALCVFSKFDRYKQDAANAALDVFQALGRQLLVGSEATFARHRQILREALGNNLGVGPCTLPEFKLLLGEQPIVAISDPNEAEARTAQASFSILRALACADSPLVLAFDDMQWAPKASLRMLEAIVTSADPLPGLLVVCAYRSGEAREATALDELIERWKLIELAPPEIRLDSLSDTAVTEFVASMLRLPLEAAQALSPILAERSGSNPYNLVEMINALRQDGLLTPTAGTWHWDAAAIRRHVGATNVADLLSRRIAKLSKPVAELLQVVACLGGEIDLQVLALAAELHMMDVQDRLGRLVEEGLLVFVSNADHMAARFSDGRVQEAVLSTMEADARARLHLRLARSIAAHCGERAELEALASGQYLPAAELIESEAERRLAVDYFQRSAQRLRLLNNAVAEKFLAAAVKLLKSVETADDNLRLFALECELHRAVYSLGRHEDADVLWESINRRAPNIDSLAEPTRIQMYSLNNRRRFADSMNMGLALLAKVGLEKPTDMRPAIAAGLRRMAEFSAGSDKDRDFERAEATDQRVILLSNIVPHTATPAYYADPPTWVWLSLEAQKLWMEHGPAPMLLSGLCSCPSILAGMLQDYRHAYVLARHIIAVGDRRNYQPSVSYARTMCGISASHWFEPLPTTVEHFHRSFDDLLSLGDESFFLNNFILFDPLFDYSPTLDAPLAELELGFAHANRIRQQDFQQRYRPRKQLIFALRGDTKAPGSLEDDDFDEAKFLAAIDQTSVTAWVFHVVSGILALIFGDTQKMAKHTAAAMPLNARAPGYYLNANLRLMHGISLAEQARSAAPSERTALLEEFDKTCLQWMTARAVDAPMNFLHLQKWLEAERAAVAESIWQAGIAFDAALAEAAQHERPWHRAALSERAARFHFDNGLERSGRELLAQALAVYTAWGAAGKVKELRRRHAFLRAGNKTSTERTAVSTLRGTMVDTDMVDMLAVLRASQALSSETNLHGLTAALTKILSAITGATRVQLLVKLEDGGSWVLAESLAAGATPIPIERAAANGELPYSVCKYVERTSQVLVIEDLTQDERFNTDPYAERFAHCSMMLVPVVKQGQTSGLLILENDQRRAAFSAERLDSVALIAGQLSVSLDNALLYASLERRVAERTAQLRQKTNDINAMLQNMPQGVLTVTRGGVIHPEYSAYLATILETSDIADRPFMEIMFAETNLGSDARAQVDAAIGACIGEDAMNFDFNSHLLVTAVEKRIAGTVKSLALFWSPIVDDAGTIEKLMVCVRDVTELKRLEAEANARKRELQMIGEILAVDRHKFREFIKSARGFVADNRRLLEMRQCGAAEVANRLYRNMHTIKGNARTFALRELTNLVHVAEQSYEPLRRDPEAPWNAANLLHDLDAVQALIDEYARIEQDVLGGGAGSQPSVESQLMVERSTVRDLFNVLTRAADGDESMLRSAVREALVRVRSIGAMSLQTMLSSVIESLPSLARELGKEAPQIIFHDQGIALDSDLQPLINNVFTHLLRNAVDHGIETPSERAAAGKPAAGTIAVTVTLNQDKLQIAVRDDGRGLALGKIRARAVEQGLVDPHASAEQVAQLIFLPGMSTSERVTAVSGRGVGMDAVLSFIRDAGGDIAITLPSEAREPYCAFELVLTLPSRYAATGCAAKST